MRRGAIPAGEMHVPLPSPTPSGRTGSTPPAAKAARFPTPTVMMPPAPPACGRSPGGAPGSSNDPPAAPKAGRNTPRPPKVCPTAGAARDPTSYISASNWEQMEHLRDVFPTFPETACVCGETSTAGSSTRVSQCRFRTAAWTPGFGQY